MVPDFYRQLHVMPDAPIEVIRAAYRALMWTHHPDNGGEHDLAVRINEAWNVLGDPEQRAAYDAELRARRAMYEHVPVPPAPPVPLTECAFCRAVVELGDARCTHCRAPLTRIAVRVIRPLVTARAKERRRLPRVSRNDWGKLYLTPLAPGVDVRLRNLSLEGVSFFSGTPVALGQRLRVSGEAFDAVLDVVHCSRQNKVFVVNGRFVTAEYAAARSAL